MKLLYSLLIRDHHEYVMANTLKHVLIVRPDALGDMVLSLPLIQAVKEAHPSAEITVLCKGFMQAFLKHIPAVSNTLLDLCECKNMPMFSKSFFSYANTLKRHSFDAVVLAYQDSFYAALCFVAGIPIRIGDKNRFLERLWLTHTVPLDFNSRHFHEIENRLRLGEPLGIDIQKSISFGIVIPAFTHHFVEKSIEQAVGSHRPLVGIHANLGQGNRAWHAKRYAQLIDRLDRAGYSVVLTGQGKDKESVHAILENTNTHVMNALDEFDLIQLAALWQKCTVIIGAETGPIHLAAALSRPIVSISPTKFIESFRWGPLTAPHVIVCESQHCDLVCHTYQKQCLENNCLDAILVENVFQAVQSVQKLSTRSIPETKDYWQSHLAKTAILLPSFSENILKHIALLKKRYEHYRLDLIFYVKAKDRKKWSCYCDVQEWPYSLVAQYELCLHNNFTHFFVFNRRDFLYLNMMFLFLGARINAAPALDKITINSV